MIVGRGREGRHRIPAGGNLAAALRVELMTARPVRGSPRPNPPQTEVVSAVPWTLVQRSRHAGNRSSIAAARAKAERCAGDTDPSEPAATAGVATDRGRAGVARTARPVASTVGRPQGRVGRSTRPAPVDAHRQSRAATGAGPDRRYRCSDGTGPGAYRDGRSADRRGRASEHARYAQGPERHRQTGDRR